MAKEITDDFIRSQKTVTTHDAAKYLGVTWPVLTAGLKNGKFTFGSATLCRGGTYSYTIWGEKLYRFKNGIGQGMHEEALLLAKKMDELIAEIRDFNARWKQAG